MIEGSVNRFYVHCADRAEILGHDQIGSKVAQGSFVKVVNVVSRRHPGTDLSVDLARIQTLGQGGCRDDLARTSFYWEVALEGHADHVVTGSDGEKDLRG